MDRQFGALQSPPDERDYPIQHLYSTAGIVAAVTLPATYVVSNRPPILDQGDTPMCVAYSSSALKSFHDRDDQTPAKWWNFDERLFFRQIGGTSQGAYLRAAMDRLLKAGYPVVTVGQAAQHRIRGYYAVDPHDAMALKSAIKAFGLLVLAMPWWHSWFRPDPVTYVLPRPDYQVGGHAILADGWNDAKGLRLRNSWGYEWGYHGDCYLPYAYLSAAWEAWKTLDTP